MSAGRQELLSLGLISTLVLLATPAVHAAKVIFVKLYVDEEEVTNESAWHQRLSSRLNSAAEIIAKHTDVRFAVVGYGTWQSDNRLQDLPKSLDEFAQEVAVGTERIAIGFSSQYKFQSGRNNLGGTRGPMRSHILIRENARPVLEMERLEVLVHELGHFLCAGHSASPTSVMRPVIGDGQARAAAFHITFDPINSKILRLVGRELRDGNIQQFRDLSPVTLLQLREQYTQLASQLPEDPTAARYISVIDACLQMVPSAEDLRKILIPAPMKTEGSKAR